MIAKHCRGTMTHAEVKSKALQRPVVRAEFERIEREEMPMLDEILKARHEVRELFSESARHRHSTGAMRNGKW